MEAITVGIKYILLGVAFAIAWWAMDGFPIFWRKDKDGE